MDSNRTNETELPETTDLYIQNSKSSDLIKPTESSGKLENIAHGKCN